MDLASILSMLAIVVSVLAGVLLDKLKATPGARYLEACIAWALRLLLFCMGIRLGRNVDFLANLSGIGSLGIAFAVATVAGTIIALIPLYLVFRKRLAPALAPGLASTPKRSGIPSGGSWISGFARGPLLLIGIVVLGALAGLLVPFFPGLTIPDLWINIVLYFLLACIGAQMSQSGVNPLKALAKLETAIIPLGTIVGTLAAGFLVAIIFSKPMGKSLAVSAGFGWYSLSSSLIAGMGDSGWGAIALISNIMRESIAFILIPLIGRSPFPGIAIGVAGATSMDVTLPLIEQACGPESVPRSMASGVFLSLLVPILVPSLFAL